ncbi:MAG TPA: polyisoprenoid-binding protein [Rhodocyclaceae bacterium]|nr:MAG: polyisoprenoid-binding protein [Betaproteobacteria bacterium CG2_30_68_42]PIV74813.1 MAG: polyisoprenoid-binding protein [Rhodocyclales bacterium CG17_big_fil_post_rev_8_21_14_2_50_68_7]PIX75755.1 MAG: polyisoprenoid-binding protein [Rhodocyclales bacterium CG_4_10_14_3_um_filter_68_10]PJA58801.1 MAG: polyisoprenoid-binding protein [Rhodocyclales bacterium CG_4_9_14_3_um_filter_68_10]HCX32700.1 polyisoprenoid-binding protein [Rhodocyclaceae bacterium]
MSRLLALLLALLAGVSAQAAEIGQVQADKSRLSFAYTQMGVPMEGTFRRFSAKMSFDPARVPSARASIEVDVAGIDTGSAEADQEVKGKLWFDAATHPTAHFVSTAVKALGGNRFEARGKLTLKGRTLDTAAPFTFTPTPQGGAFDGAFTLKRLDYAIGEGMWADVSAVANEVLIRFHIVAGSAPAKK